MARYYRRHHKHHHHRHYPHRYHAQPLNAKRTFYKTHSFITRHPLISATAAIIVSIILLRVSASSTLFGQNITEFRLWFVFFALVIGLIGVIALIVWFRNNVSQLTTRHTINFRR